MAKKSKTGGKAFSELVRAKLAERGWSQRRLGEAIHRGSSYMSYLVRGENPGARGGKFGLQPDVVTAIAAELGIPLDEAFRVAGLESPPAHEIPIGRQDVVSGKDVSQRKGKGDTDQRLFDIAYEAALEAVKAEAAGESEATPRTKNRIKINLGKGADLVLTTEKQLTDDEIAGYTLAFRLAFETVAHKFGRQNGEI